MRAESSYDPSTQAERPIWRRCTLCHRMAIFSASERRRDRHGRCAACVTRQVNAARTLSTVMPGSAALD